MRPRSLLLPLLPRPALPHHPGGAAMSDDDDDDGEGNQNEGQRRSGTRPMSTESQSGVASSGMEKVGGSREPRRSGERWGNWDLASPLPQHIVQSLPKPDIHNAFVGCHTPWQTNFGLA